MFMFLSYFTAFYPFHLGQKAALILFLFYLFTCFMSVRIQNILYLPVKMQMWPNGNNSPSELAGWTDSLWLSRAFPTALRAEPGESFSPGVPHLPLSGRSGWRPAPNTHLTHQWVSWPLCTGLTVLHSASKNPVLTGEE